MWAARLGWRGSISDRDRAFSLSSQTCRLALCLMLPPTQWKPRMIIPAVKRPGRGDSSPPAGASVINACTSTSCVAATAQLVLLLV